ncbi:hypothetical protein HBH98_183080 [Parastagonospora nodorum]|nr:hypothetical protein HBH98_183080 [Parastagonospora nodorum]KAH5046364.1 hypothetical protein HBI73_251060 [Parastagonospora nodorum]KAH6384459.1 hypothetical protein HBI60_243900 [Parastagonospora nodorum]
MPSTTVSQLSSNQSTDPSDLSVQELKRLLVTQKPDTDVQGGAKWRIIAKGGDIATEKFQIPRTDIAAKRLLFPTWPEEFCELSRFERRASHNYLFKNFSMTISWRTSA